MSVYKPTKKQRAEIAKQFLALAAELFRNDPFTVDCEYETEVDEAASHLSSFLSYRHTGRVTLTITGLRDQPKRRSKAVK